MRPATLLFFLFASLLPAASQTAAYKYIRIGQQKDAVTIPTFGIAMMGGGSDLDEAFRWMCDKAHGGDFLILRARGADDYNPYVNGLCKLNSVATLIIDTRESAQDPAVAEIIRHAEAIFIAGGDQARYVNFWRGTAVQTAINADIAQGIPIGGTSAGLAILGEFSYGALNDPPDDSSLTSADALRNPFFTRITLVRDFLDIPVLQNTITDSHFAKRDRLGRSLVFLARIMQDGWSTHPREIAVDEKNAVLVEADGKSRIVGSGKGVYFLSVANPPEVCRAETPLTFRKIAVYHAPPGSQFDVRDWHGVGGTEYSLSVEAGQIHSTQAAGQLY
ncbi:MAG: cyanophycinase [Acidobacteriaceae bacterium]|nr:cyanophycinase [Acidobacteriaceae bacterium]